MRTPVATPSRTARAACSRQAASIPSPASTFASTASASGSSVAQPVSCASSTAAWAWVSAAAQSPSRQQAAARYVSRNGSNPTAPADRVLRTPASSHRRAASGSSTEA